MGMDTFGMDDVCIKVYDPIKKELLSTYDTYTEAAQKTGISTRVIKIAIRSKTRRYSPFLKKEVALRIASKKPV
jgi:hypothetical protein